MVIQDVLSKLDKQFGKGTIGRLGDHDRVKVDVIPTGLLSLDLALGVGGIPRGRVVEIVGLESGGKTSLTLSVIGQAQKAGGMVAFIDAEHSFDPDWASKLGVDVDNLLVSQPDYGEQALEIASSLIQSGLLFLVVIDSVAALTPKSEIEGEFGDAQMGLQARMMSQAMRKLTAVTHKSNTSFILINQIREKLGVMFGSPETTPGGKALRFYSSVRLDVRRSQTIKEGENSVGNRVKIKVIKNKCAPPFRSTEVDLLFKSGFSHVGDLVDLGVTHGVVQKSGSWFSLNGERIGQGRANAVSYLEENKEVADKLEAEIRKLL